MVSALAATTPLDTEHLLATDAESLPESLLLVVSYIGLDATLRLVAEFGGRSVSVPRGSGGESYQRLQRVVGSAAADALCWGFAGTKLYVPVCKGLRMRLRRRQLQCEFDALHQNGSAGHAVSELSRRHCITERWLYALIARARSERTGKQ